MKRYWDFFFAVTEKILARASFLCAVLLALIVLCSLFIFPIFIYFNKDLPDYHQLVKYDPPTISRIYAGDGELISELATERRIFKTIDEIPELVKNAFIAAEDQNYYRHPGIDVFSIVRAAVQNIMNMGSDRHPVGGSTITQQVVKNFLLTPERTIARKIKEAILAYRINKVYSKDRILELYLNQIYLGNGAYGVAQASISYFDKDMKNLTVAEAALLAAMPKAPSILDPVHHPERAMTRRNWVIDRMHEENFITTESAKSAAEAPLGLNQRLNSELYDSGYYNEAVRLNLVDKYGFNHVYQEGLMVHTNMDQRLQKIADEALRQGLREYDRRHGWHGVLANLKFEGDEWVSLLNRQHISNSAGNWKPAIVLNVAKDSATIGLTDGSKTTLPLSGMSWARKRLPDQEIGGKPESVKDVLKQGDVVLVGYNSDARNYTLEQVPDVNGAIVVIEVKTGKVLAMTGGYNFKDSNYNRVTQALRQPGSVFKPIVYLAALENGYSPMSIVRDEPISISQGPGMPLWRPKNYEGKFLGPITLRTALAKSRNLATVHIVANLGVGAVAEMAERLNVYKSPPIIYSMALGAYETTLLDLTTAFATFASGGIKVEPKLIDRIVDRKGKLIYTGDNIKCVEGCLSLPTGDGNDQNIGDSLSQLQFDAVQLIDPTINYQMVTMLEDAVQRGTAVRAKALGKHIAGKTGTTNESKDTWFIGFSPDIVVGVFVGFDAPKTLGSKEQGSSLALPIFVNFMKQALDKMPDKEFSIPQGVEIRTIDPITGVKVDPSSKRAVIEVINPDQNKDLPWASFSDPSAGPDLQNEGAVTQDYPGLDNIIENPY